MKRMNAQLAIASFILLVGVFLSGCEVFYPRQLEEDYQANILSTTEDTTAEQTTANEVTTTTSTNAKSTAKSTVKTTATSKAKATTTVTTTAKKNNTSKPKPVTGNAPLSEGGNSVYAFNQLTKSEQKIYKKIVSGIEACKPKIHLASGDPLDSDAVFSIYFAVLADHPEFFHVGNQVGYEFDGKDTYIDKINLDKSGKAVSSYNASTYKSMKSKLDKKVNKLISATKSMNNYERVKYFHDYIVLNTDYVENKANSHNLYGVLIEGEAVCEGYARALQYLCNRSGIECLFITGMSKDQHHGWNLVKLGGDFYHIDPTWNDPVGAPADYITYAYFGLTDKQIGADHYFSNADRSVSHYKKLPAANGTKYNYHTYNKLLFTSAANAEKDLTKAILNAAKSKQKYVEIKFSDFATYQDAYSKLKSGGFSNALNAAAEKNKKISTKMNSFRYNDAQYILSFEISYK